MKAIKTKSRFNIAQKILIFWTFFIGIGAVAGAVTMLIDPSGHAMNMDAMLPYFQKLPFADVIFQDLVFSGIALLIVNGLTNLTAGILLLLHRRLGVILGGIFGVTLMLWICIQFYIFPFNFMSTAFFIFGFLQAATGYAAYVFSKQESFCVNEAAYPNIGRTRKKLVVYFSRMGYVKKTAYEIANECGADLYQVKSTEKTDGTLGFWWCGRFGMHHWPMPIEPVSIDLEAYDHVTICSPIWVAALCPPIKEFCIQASGKIKEADYVFLHFNNAKYLGAADEADELLNIKRTEIRSIRCRYGKMKEVFHTPNTDTTNHLKGI